MALVMLAGGFASVAPAQASQIFAVFTDPVLRGYDYNDPTIGAVAPVDNSTTAVTTGVGTSTLTWGTNPAGTAQRTGTFSSLTFTGMTGLPEKAASPIPIGTISYFNGTSAGSTIIFGATIKFYDSAALTNFLGSDDVFITTTNNQYSGTALTDAQREVDADFVNICGNGSMICQKSIESYEATQTVGYTPLVVDLYASYDFDPSITLTNVTFNSGSGVVGTQAAAVPEPGSIAVLGFAIAGLATSRFLKRRS